MKRLLISLALVVGMLASVNVHAANPDRPYGFAPYGPCSSLNHSCGGSATFVKGDVVYLASGVVEIVTAGTTREVYGVAAEGCTSGTPDSGSYVAIYPAEDCIFQGQTSGTGAITQLGTTVDIEGATSAMEVNENATSAPNFKMLGLVGTPDNSWGANAQVFGRFTRPQGTWSDVNYDDIATTIVRADYGLSHSQSTGLQVDIAAANSGLEFSGGDLAIDLAASNPGLQFSSDELALLVLANTGLTVGATGLTTVIEANKGLAVGASGFATVLEANKGLEVGASGLAITVDADSMSVGASGIAAALQSNKGLEASTGLGVVVDANSMSVGAGGIAAVLQSNKGLEASAGLGVLVDANSMSVGAGGIAAVLQASKGLEASSGLGVVLESNKGLSVGASGIAVDYDGSNISINGSNQLDIKERCMVVTFLGDSADKHRPFTVPWAGTVQATWWLVSQVATVGSGATTRWEFDISDSAGNDMTATDWTTQTAELAADVPVALTVDQNRVVTAGEGLYIDLIETDGGGAPTDLSGSWMAATICIDTF
jgi:hypothetical protein